MLIYSHYLNLENKLFSSVPRKSAREKRSFAIQNRTVNKVCGTPEIRKSQQQTDELSRIKHVKI